MKRFSALVLTAAVLLSLTACEADNKSSSVVLPQQSEISNSSEENSSALSGSGLSSLTEWDYVTKVRDNFEKYYIASSSPKNGLPNISSNLLVRSIEEAVSDDKSGVLKALLEKFCAEPDVDERIRLTDEILNILCKTDEITEVNDVFSPKKRTVLEGFWGTGDVFPAPFASLTAEPLEEAYTFLTQRYCLAMIGSQYIDYIDLIGSEKGTDGKYHPNMENYNKRVFDDYANGVISEKQVADNALYLAYYGVLRDKNLEMLESFTIYTEENAPDLMNTVYMASNKASQLFSGINGVTIPVRPVDDSETAESGEADEPQNSAVNELS